MKIMTPADAPRGNPGVRSRALALGGGGRVDRALCGYLARYGIDVREVGGAGDIHDRLVPGRFDILLLDLRPPGEDALGLCVSAQQVAPDIPVIILTPEDDVPSRVAGLELGADDCLASPFEPRELAARIKAVLRRRTRRRAGAPADRFEGWEFDRTRRVLAREGSVVLLSAYEARLLSALIDHRWQVLSRARLLALSNGSAADVTYRSVDLAISRLRAKIGDDGRQATMIRTVRGAGYLFDAGPRP